MAGSSKAAGLLGGPVLVAVAACLLWAGTGTAQARTPHDFWGMDMAVPGKADEFTAMRSAGVEVYRIAITWNTVERNEPVETPAGTIHHYDWRGPDAEMRALVAAGLDPHVALIGCPAWVNGNSHHTPMSTRAGRRGWAAFVAAVAARYGPGGVFWQNNSDLPVRTPVAYQIWNEENSEIAYAPKADPAEYAGLMRLAGKQIRKRDPGAEILPGGMFGTPQLDHSMYAWVFLRKLLRQPGVRRYIDAVAAHPYAPHMRGVRYQLHRVRKVLRKQGLGRTPLQITELGWSSARPHKGRKGSTLFYKGRRGQAKMTYKALRLLTRKRRRWRIERVIWFTWRDLEEWETNHSGCGFCRKMGLVRLDGTPKRAYRKFVHFSKR